eukprot:3631779-Prymnesium_polylepis.1
MPRQPKPWYREAATSRRRSCVLNGAVHVSQLSSRTAINPGPLVPVRTSEVLAEGVSQTISLRELPTEGGKVDARLVLSRHCLLQHERLICPQKHTQNHRSAVALSMICTPRPPWSMVGLSITGKQLTASGVGYSVMARVERVHDQPCVTSTIQTGAKL